MQTSTSAYPLTLKGDLQSPVSRWLFLVKWLLILPHLLVLALLWTALVVAWLIALFAVLFTSKYPRALFNFNVGVLRWTWRVSFYGYGALGTDRYPPFSLKTQIDYPADLDVIYPERLKPGFAVIQWWLLAVPHYVIVGIFEGGLGWRWTGGLKSVLVLIAAVANLFTGRYPRDLFDLIMGINWWVYRVAAYALFMTNQYPPFRLGQ